MSQLALPLFRGYGSPVAVSPAAGLGRPIRPRRYSAHLCMQALFLCPSCCFMAGCVGTPSGVPVPLDAGRPTLRNPSPLPAWPQAVTVPQSKENHHMQHAPNPSAFQQHAAAWRARAIAALHSNSSLSVRLARYNAAMARARSLEAQEVANA